MSGRGGRKPSATPSGMPYEPTTSDWFGRFRLRPNASNDYFVDREKQRRKDTFTGIEGVHIQDQAVTESEGPIFDRSKEHLGSSDAMIMRTRRRLMKSATYRRLPGPHPRKSASRETTTSAWRKS